MIMDAAKVFEAEGFASPAQRLVLLELTYRADRRGIIRYTQSEIASASALSRPTVSRWLSEFSECGIIDNVGHGRYRLQRSCLEDLGSLIQPTRVTTEAPGAKEEFERLQAVCEPDEAIVYSSQGWPILRLKSELGMD
mgnify:CR=1 FL=1